MMVNDNNLVWIDLEMTGLSPKENHIIEIASIVTNNQLEILEEGPVFAIHQSNNRLDKMDAWNTEHHQQSGLIQRVRESTVSEKEAEDLTLEFLQKYVPENKSPMCGNSICQDRRFLYTYMPKLEAYFHYRNIDVSTIKILANHWAPKLANQLKKTPTHTALQDIRDSIEELRFYQRHFFKIPTA